MANIISPIIRTVSNLFKIQAVGGTGIALKDNAGLAEFRNVGDSAYSSTKALNIEATGLAKSATIQVTTSPTNGYYLQSDASGNGSWAALTGLTASAVQVKKFSFTQATTSPATIITLPANSVITRVTTIMSVAAAAAGASITLGISGTAARDLAATDTDLRDTAVQPTFPMTDTTASPTASILTIVVGGQTFTGVLYISYATYA